MSSSSRPWVRTKETFERPVRARRASASMTSETSAQTSSPTCPATRRATRPPPHPRSSTRAPGARRGPRASTKTSSPWPVTWLPTSGLMERACSSWRIQGRLWSPRTPCTAPRAALRAVCATSRGERRWARRKARARPRRPGGASIRSRSSAVSFHRRPCASGPGRCSAAGLIPPASRAAAGRRATGRPPGAVRRRPSCRGPLATRRSCRGHGPRSRTSPCIPRRRVAGGTRASRP